MSNYPECRVTFGTRDEMKMNGGTLVAGISTLSECKDLCLSDTRCVAVSWNDDHAGTTNCYYNDAQSGYQYSQYYTSYPVLARFCPDGKQTFVNIIKLHKKAYTAISYIFRRFIIQLMEAVFSRLFRILYQARGLQSEWWFKLFYANHYKGGVYATLSEQPGMYRDRLDKDWD